MTKLSDTIASLSAARRQLADTSIPLLDRFTVVDHALANAAVDLKTIHNDLITIADQLLDPMLVLVSRLSAKKAEVPSD